MNTVERTKLLVQWSQAEPEIAYFSSSTTFHLVSHNLTHSVAVETTDSRTEIWDKLLSMVMDHICFNHSLSIGFSMAKGQKYVVSLISGEQDFALSRPSFSKGLALIDAYVQYLYQIGAPKT